MVKELTCIICPQGCSIKVETDENNNIKKVEGNTSWWRCIWKSSKIIKKILFKKGESPF